MTREGLLELELQLQDVRACRLRTNGVKITGAAAKTMDFDRLVKNGTPGIIRKITNLRGHEC